MATSRLHVDPNYIKKADAPGFADAFARIVSRRHSGLLSTPDVCECLQESHYFVNGGFMPEGELLKKENIDKIRHVSRPALTAGNTRLSRLFRRSQRSLSKADTTSCAR